MKKYFMLLSTLILLFFFTNINYVQAKEEISSKNYVPNEINYNTDGGNINLSSSYSDDGIYTVHAQFDTTDLDDGYYTAFIYETINRSLEEHDGIAFNFTNLGGSSVDLNINIITKNDEEYKITTEKPVYIKESGNNYLTQVEVTNGSFRLDEGFDGKIIIPFDNVNSIENYSNLDKSNIALWGISVTIEENNIEQFEISDFSYINFNIDLDYYVNGDNDVTIPDEGEFIYLYNVSKGTYENNLGINEFYDKNKNYYKDVVFKMYEDIDKVSISEDGVLSIESDALPQQITIVASINNNLEQGYKINLVNSNEKGIVIDDDISLEIPKIDDLSNSIKSISILQNNKFVKIFRTLICVIFIGFISIIILWMRENLIR